MDDLTDLQWRAVPVLRAERLIRREPLDLAIDLFLLQGALSKTEFDQLFGVDEQNALIRSGILAQDNAGFVRSRAGLFPVGNRLIFSDHAWPELPHPGLTPVPYDQVMWIGMDSRHLARCTSRRRFGSALDLCTGSGIHALLASEHAENVVAVDINPRAADCTRFNGAIWGSANLQVRVGDLFEAIDDERFHLITANPPFVPSPLNTLGFRDGGASGEDVLKRIVAGLPKHLSAGGIAQIITELGEREGEPLACRIREWLGSARMDIHILRLGEHTSLKYAIGHSKGDDYQAVLDSVGEWHTNLRQQGYDRVVSVVISFQWSDGPSWEREDRSPPPRRPAGAEIEAMFLAERMARHPDCADALRNSRISRTGPIALMDARVSGQDLRAKTKATLLGQALTIEHHLDAAEVDCLERLDASAEAARSLLRRRLIRIDPA